MSFSTEVKSNILSLKFKHKCCKKAFFYGALMGAEVSDGLLSVKISDCECADFITYIASTVFKIKEMDISEISRGFCRMTTIKFKLPTFISMLNDIDGNVAKEDILTSFFDCESCISYFFGGLFCATGTLSDPEKCHSLEMSLPNKQRAEIINALFVSRTDLVPKIIKRKKGYGVYFRSADGVVGFLTLCNIGTVVFDYLNQQFSNQLRSDENRATNCVTSNIKRSVSANLPQIRAIQKLMDSGKYNLLSDELKETATLRMENPELSLKALASIHNPTITKSGLVHRIEKIIKLSDEQL